MIRYKWLCIVLALSVSSLACAQNEEPQSALLTRAVLEAAGAPYKWILEERVRGAYMSGITDVPYYQELGEAGFNTILNKINTVDDVAFVEFHSEQAQLSQDAGMKYFPFINFNSEIERRYVDNQFVPFVTFDGHELAKTVSPLDESFWLKVIRDRWVLLAEAAKNAPITGSIIDFEMYGADSIFYDRIGVVDYSDLAFNGFLAAQNITLDAPVVPGDRKAWLEERALSEAYAEYHRQTIRGFCADIQRAVHEVNPEFIIGFYSWHPGSLFYESCAQGFGTPEYPVLLFPGTTYSHGYTEPGVDRQVLSLHDMQAHAVFIPGLWTWQFHEENLAAAAYFSTRHAGGYWLYGTYAFWQDTAARRRIAPLDGTVYLGALARANSEIEVVLKNPGHVTELRTDPDRSIFLGVDPGNFDIPMNMRFAGESIPAAIPIDQQPPAPQVRRIGVYRAYAEAGTTMNLRINAVRTGPITAGTVVTVLDPDRGFVKEERIPVGETRDITVECAKTGAYAILCSSNQLSHWVQCDAPGFALSAADDGIHFFVRMAPLYFYVPEGTQEFTITGVGQGEERFNLTITDAAGNIALFHEDISQKKDFAITVSEGQCGKVWKMDIERPTNGVLEDVQIWLSGIPPYLSPSPERLIIPAHD